MTWSFVAALTLLAFGLRLAGLHESLTGDELFAYDDVHARSLFSTITYIGHNEESSPPLFFVLAWFAAHFGNATETIRWPSILLGSAAVPLTYSLGRRAFTLLAGLVAATLLALNPLSIWQGAEARPYEALLCFAVLSTLVLLTALDSSKRWSWWWAAYAASVAAVALTHYTGVFVLGAQTLWALWARHDRWRQIVAASFGGFLLFSWWLPYFHSSYVAVYNLLGVPLVPDQIGKTLLQAVIGHPGYGSLSSVPGTVPTAAFLAVVSGGILLAGLPAVRHHGARNASRSRVALIGLLAIATPVGILVYSAFKDNLLLVHNLVASLPFALIAVAGVTTSLRSRSPALAAGATVVVVGVTLVGTIKTLAPDAERADFRDAFAFVNARASSNDTIIDGSLFPFTPGYQRYVPAYFAHRYVATTRGTPQAAAAWSRARSGGRVFVVEEATGPLRHYRATPFDGPDPSCARASTARSAPPGCVRLRATHTFRGLQRVVVSMYSGR